MKLLINRAISEEVNLLRQQKLKHQNPNYNDEWSKSQQQGFIRGMEYLADRIENDGQYPMFNLEDEYPSIKFKKRFI
jgi:hypothetical protein